MLPHRREIASLVVCEDDTTTRELLCDHLVADRFEVLPAPSASDALRLCRYNHPDLLLLDLTLPDASGLDVLHEIRNADGVGARFNPRLPVIVLTGRGADADRVRGLDAGADDYILKPYLYEELRGSVSSNRFQLSRAKNRGLRMPLKVAFEADFTQECPRNNRNVRELVFPCDRGQGLVPLSRLNFYLREGEAAKRLWLRPAAQC